MKNLGEPLSDRELTDMMKEADMDKDGKINYEGKATRCYVVNIYLLSVIRVKLKDSELKKRMNMSKSTERQNG